MPRIFGVSIPDKKSILYSLPYLFGVGLALSRVILDETGIDSRKLAQDLSGDEINKIQKFIEQKYIVEGDLRKEIGQNIKHQKETGTWRGVRLARRLPIRGRSKTNSRTTRGNVRKTMGSGRIKADAKT